MRELWEKVERTAWRDRLIFNTWRMPFPYLFHRWTVMCEMGYCAGFWRKSKADAYATELSKH